MQVINYPFPSIYSPTQVIIADDSIGYGNAVESKSIPMEDLPNYENWSGDQWISFHKKLKNRYGKEDANRVWSEFFNNKPIGWSRDGVLTAQRYFTDYFKRQGIKFNDTFYSYLDDAGSFLSSIPSGVKTAAIVVGVVGGLAIIIILANGFIKAAKEAKSLNDAGNKFRKRILDEPELLVKAIL